MLIFILRAHFPFDFFLNFSFGRSRDCPNSKKISPSQTPNCILVLSVCLSVRQPENLLRISSAFRMEHVR